MFMRVTGLEVLVILQAAGLFPLLGAAQLGDAPRAPKPEEVLRLRLQIPATTGARSSFNVNIASREEVRNFFNAVYGTSEYSAMGWNGNVTNCNAGTTTASFRDLVLIRINFYRAMAGVPAGIVWNDAWNGKDQQAALMMSANNQLNHQPPTPWTCYTEDGAEAAGNSNIALGNSGPEAITSYVEDWGPANYSVGHRRWIIYPQTESMGTGDLPSAGTNYSANATWVLDGNYGGPRPATRETFVSWPPPGYVPYQVVCPRWSFSYADADFSGASVTLSSNGVSVPVTLEAVDNWYGENTLVWHPTCLDPSDSYSWPRPATNVVYGVNVQNVLVGGNARTFNYSVTVFDPAAPGPDTVLPAIAGNDHPSVNYPNAYSFTTLTNATGYQWRQSRRLPYAYVEGAENGLGYFTTHLSPGYSAIVANPRGAGNVFHLAQPEPTDQLLTYTRRLLPGTNSQMQFKSMLGYATTGQVANVQVALDQGCAWQDVYRQAGTNGGGETSFKTNTISLTNFLGRSILVRFRYLYLGGSYYPQTSSGIGWYFDDISFSNTEELTNSVISEVANGSSFVFTPAQPTNYVLDTRAAIQGGFYLEWGPAKRVTATTNPPPAIHFVSGPTGTVSQVHMEFTVTNYRTNMTFQLSKAASPEGNWIADVSANFQTVITNSRYRITTSTGGAGRTFYRLTANW